MRRAAGAPGERVFDTPAALATALARAIAQALRDAIAARGRATLIVSGGTTPRATFAALAGAAIAWERVTVSLADERWVPVTDPASNEALVRDTLLRDAAAAARFVGLYTGDATPEAGAAACAARLAALPRPFDVVLLGMGEDGHTASLFAGAAGLAAALDVTGEALCSALRAPGMGTPRITLTVRALLDARCVFLLFQGERKRAVYEAALTEGAVERMPVRAILRQQRVPVEVYWSRSAQTTPLVDV